MGRLTLPGSCPRLVILRTSLVPAPRLGVTFMPDGVEGGRATTGRVTLAAPAPAAGAAVALRSDNPAATVPDGVTVPAGATTATFAVATRPVPVDPQVTITASFGGDVGSVALVVLARSSH